MQNKRPIILCTFSNDGEFSLRLNREERSIREALRELRSQQHIEYIQIPQANLDDIYKEFNTYHNRIYIFHYGGHSDSEFLHLQEHHARTEELAILIGQQKHLKLVFLNGCANRLQVRFLLDHRVPAVIATSERVHDEYACLFAAQFYAAFAAGKSIQDAFDAAKSYVQQIQNGIEFVTERGCRPRNPVEKTVPWDLYCEDDAVLNWHIGMVEQESKAEIRAKLKQASRERYLRFTNADGRFQHLRIDDAILSGIRDVSQSKRKPIEDNFALDGLQHPLHQSLPNLWSASCSHAMLVGPGGMGKTVSLLRLWEQFLEIEDENAPIPIFIQLNEFNSRPERDFIQNYIRAHYADLNFDEVFKTPLLDLSGKPRPIILLLLDGFNEVTATSNELILELNRLRVREDYPGLQVVLTSRVDIRAIYQWQSFHLLELQPLSDKQIQAYLRKEILTDSRLVEVLRNPMMLSLYATQSELPKRYHERGLLLEQVTSTGELLFNVEAIQRIKIEENFNHEPSAKALRRFVLEHLLPCLGWAMQQAGLFFIEETNRNGTLSVFDFLSRIPEDLLHQDFFVVFKDLRKLDHAALKEKEAWELQDELIDLICCEELTLLVSENDSYRFLHQNFRDYFVARYLQNQIRLGLYQESLPRAFCQGPLDFYVRQMLGELEGEHSNKMVYNDTDKKWQWSEGKFFLENNLSDLLEQCRGVFEEKKLGYTVWNLLTLWKEQRGEYSGANLSRLNFRNFSMNGILASRPGLSVGFFGGILGEENLFPQGHSDKVNSIAYSPDGSRIVTGSDDKTAKIWDAKTGQCLLTLEGHSDLINSVAYSLDGSRIISGSGDNTAKVWDVQTGHCLLIMEGHSDWVNSVAFNPSGSRIVTGSDDKTAKIWDAQTGQCLLTLEGHSDLVNSVAYSSDKEHIVTGSSDESAKVWDAQTGQCMLTLRGHLSKIRSVTYSPNGSRIATVSQYGEARLWDAQTGQCQLILDSDFTEIENVAFNPNGNSIATVEEFGTTKVWDAQTGQCLLILEGEFGVRSVAYSPDGSCIITGCSDNSAKVFDAQTGKCVLTLNGYSSGLKSIDYSTEGNYILIGSKDKTAKLWDIQTGLCFLTEEDYYWDNIAYSPDGNKFVSFYWDETAKIWDAQTGQCLLTLDSDLERIISAAYSLDGRNIVTGSENSMAKVWDAQTGFCLLTLEGDSPGASSVIYSPDGTRIATGSKKGTAKIWDAKTGQCLLTLEGHSDRIYSVVYSPDGSRLVTGLFNNTAKVWDARTGQCLLTLENGSDWEKNMVAYDPKGNHIATGSEKGTIKIWDAQTGQCLLTRSNIHGLFIQGCDFRDLHTDSDFSPASVALLRQYGAIFNDEDAQNWATLMEKHFGVKSN